ncbi:arylsulfatase [SAR86 cluster bacterium]|nr:arylsulfatase [SAR86 cluster bacterium]
MRILLTLSVFFSLNLFSADRPNIVIILTDDLGWGDVSYHGGFIPTPNIDQLAEDGIELNRFYANPVCSPTRASLLTGLHIFNHGVVRPFMNPAAEQTGMPPELKIMPQYFKEAGYQTALSGKWHLGMAKEEFWPTNRGFETSYGHMTGGIGYFDHTAAGRLDWHRNGKSLVEEGYSTELIANEAINIIQNKDKDRPLFLYIAFNAPHTPIEAPLKNIKSFAYLDDERDQVYAANVNALDFEIGKILDAIEDEGILDETIILFFSDNGPVFDIDPIVKVIAPNLINAKGSTAGLKGSKTSALEGGIRVPAVIWWKGVIEKSKSDQFFFVQDILPTLLSASGISISNYTKFDGKDKWINLTTNTIIPPENAFIGSRVISDERALFNDEWKLYSSKPQLIPISASYKLFNIIKDPYEKNDLSEVESEVFKKMKKIITSYEERDVVGDMNPAHSYLHGDDRQGGTELGSPWLDGNYELNNPPSLIATIFISIWILVQAFIYYFLAFGVLIFIIFYFVKKLK